MKLEKMVKKEILLTIGSVFLIMGIFVAMSYASFRKTTEGQTNEITFGNIGLSYCADEDCDDTIANIGQVIGTETVGDTTYAKSLYPTADAQALAETPYIFKVTNNGTLREVITIYLEEDETFVPGGTYEDYQNVLSTHSSYINLAFEGTELTQYKKTYAELTDKKLAKDIVLEPGETRIYKLWTWVSNTGPNTIQGTYFVANIRIEGEYLPELNGVKELTIGYSHSSALKYNGEVLSWGHNGYGQLGNNTTKNSLTPIRTIISNVRKIISGSQFTVALKENGEVWTWGNNNNSIGQLGNNTTINTSIPVGPILTGVIDIPDKISRHTAVLKESGEVWAWGYNSGGQIGDGTQNNHLTPYKIDIGDVKEICVGFDYTAALKENGELYTWGLNNYGQLGRTTSDICNISGTNYNCGKTIQKADANNIEKIYCHGYSMIVKKTNEEYWAWGNNDMGQLGIGTSYTINQTPIKINITGVKKMALGEKYTLVLKNDDSIWGFGANNYSQLGISAPDTCGGGSCALNPINIGITNAKNIYAGYAYSGVIKVNGEVWMWGQNNYGQLGDGTTVDKSVPTKINIP